jgi:exodeoxyribonuclease VII small subunit
VSDTDELEGLGYGQAVAELEAILAELESESVDVDRLADRVKRASALIRFCRERVGAARVDIERIVADLDD